MTHYQSTLDLRIGYIIIQKYCLAEKRGKKIQLLKLK